MKKKNKLEDIQGLGAGMTPRSDTVRPGDSKGPKERSGGDKPRPEPSRTPSPGPKGGQ